MVFAESGPPERLGLILVLSVVGSAIGIGAANLLSRRRHTEPAAFHGLDRPRPADPPAGRPLVSKFKLLLCGLYVLSPVDLMPEAFLGPLGLADDLVVALVGLREWYRGRGRNP